MANGILDLDFVKDGSIVQFHKQSISNRPLLRIMIIDAERLFLSAIQFGPKGVYTRVGSCGVRAGGNIIMTATESMYKRYLLGLARQLPVN